MGYKGYREYGVPGMQDFRDTGIQGLRDAGIQVLQLLEADRGCQVSPVPLEGRENPGEAQGLGLYSGSEEAEG